MSSMVLLSSLSQALRSQYESAHRTSGHLSESMSNNIDMNCLELNDIDINPSDVSPLCSFLLSKEVWSMSMSVPHIMILFKTLKSTLYSIQATRGVETLILKSSHPLDKHSIMVDDGFKGRESSVDSREGRRPGSTSFFIPKLMHAVVLFIAQSSSLHTVIMESMWIQSDLLESFGHALSTTKSGDNSRVWSKLRLRRSNL